MAADAITGCSDEDVIYVTRGTRDLRMPANQGEEGTVGSRAPEARVARPVARLARRRESRRNVIGCLCGTVVFFVARDARRLGGTKRVALMA